MWVVEWVFLWWKELHSQNTYCHMHCRGAMPMVQWKQIINWICENRIKIGLQLVLFFVCPRVKSIHWFKNLNTFWFMHSRLKAACLSTEISNDMHEVRHTYNNDDNNDNSQIKLELVKELIGIFLSYLCFFFFFFLFSPCRLRSFQLISC